MGVRVDSVDADGRSASAAVDPAGVDAPFDHSSLDDRRVEDVGIRPPERIGTGKRLDGIGTIIIRVLE